MIKDVNWNIIRAIAKRDLRMYFSNPTGYVFITLFIFLSAAAAFWQDRFFLNNLANLDQLNAVFPYLLVFFVPALTMSIWAEEKKQGTDELLFTLPATDLEIVLGKYGAALSIYTVALVLSLSHVIVLLFLGSPDLGLMFVNYLGYWLIGGTLIALGMLASQLSSNVTIAFILGAVFCSLGVFIEAMAGTLSVDLARLVAPLGIFQHFDDFARGVVSFTGLLYFVSLAGLFLYLNVLLVSQRHWPREADGVRMSTHHLVRAVSVVVILVAGVSIVSRLGLRVDGTAERLHSLNRETKALVRQIDRDRPVFVQAYISPTVPEQYVQTRANVVGLLKDVASASRGRVQIAIYDTEPFSERAKEAREKFGIQPRQIPNLQSARAGFSEVFLGLAFTCAGEEQVIPFFDRGLPAEYEIARSIRVVANTERKTVGVINTALRLFGGLDFQTMQSTPSWSVVEELRKQYEVVQITPDNPITEEVDGLLVALPSSLTQEQMDHVADFIQLGTPALLLVDPLPIVNLSLAPSEQPGANQNPFMRQQQPPQQPKGDIRGFLTSLGFRWDPSMITWDTYNPHPDLAHLPPEVVFLGRGNQNPEVFNEAHAATAKLQQLVLLYPGHIESASAEGLTYRALLQSGSISGRFPYFQMVQRNFLGSQLNRNLPHQPDLMTYTLAAEVRGTEDPAEPDEDADDPDEDADDPDEDADDPDQDADDPDQDADDPDQDAEEDNEDDLAAPSPLHVITIADLDFISEQFFEIRRIGPGNLNFDNVSFFLNAMDTLVGDESFVALRNRRVRHRTLERVENQTRDFIVQRTQEESQAEMRAEQALAAAQRRLDGKVAEVQAREDLDAQTKQIMARNLEEVENRKLDVLKTNINAEKDAEIRASEQRMESQIRRIQSGIRSLAVLLPPIPVFLLGVYIFIRRKEREREGALAAHRLREGA